MCITHVFHSHWEVEYYFILNVFLDLRVSQTSELTVRVGRLDSYRAISEALISEINDCKSEQ